MILHSVVVVKICRRLGVVLSVNRCRKCAVLLPFDVAGSDADRRVRCLPSCEAVCRAIWVRWLQGLLVKWSLYLNFEDLLFCWFCWSSELHSKILFEHLRARTLITRYTSVRIQRSRSMFVNMHRNYSGSKWQPRRLQLWTKCSPPRCAAGVISWSRDLSELVAPISSAIGNNRAAN